MARKNFRRQLEEDNSDESTDGGKCGDETKVRIKKEMDETGSKFPKNSKLYQYIQTAIFCEDTDKYEEATKYWNAVLKYFATEKNSHHSVKHATKLKYCSGRTPLLLATEGNAPFRVIKALVHANEESCAEPFTDDNAYALHNACAHQRKQTKQPQRNPEQTIRLLMETYPQAIMKQHEIGNATALHLLLKIKPSLKLVQDMIQLSNNQVVGVVKIERNSILNMKDSEHQLPIHVAIQWEASDDVITYLCESFPNGLNLKLPKENLSCLHLAIIYQRYNVVGKIADLYPEKIRCKSKIGHTPLHSLLWHEEHREISKERVHSIFRQLLISYKKYLVQREPKKVDKRMKYFLKSIKDNSNHNIIQVAEQALNHNHPGVNFELVQMLEDVSQGNYSSLDHPQEGDGKTGNNTGSSSRTNSKTRITLNVKDRKRTSIHHHHNTTEMDQEKKQKHTYSEYDDDDEIEQTMPFFDGNEATFSDVSLDWNNDKAIFMTHNNKIDDLPTNVAHDTLMETSAKMPPQGPKDVPTESTTINAKKSTFTLNFYAYGPPSSNH